MLLKRFYDEPLAQASYLVASSRSGQAIVVDPNRDVAQYLDAADAAGLRIAYVTETHIHADFVSGARELAARTGATLLLSAEGGSQWQYGFAAADGARLLRHGDAIELGEVRIEVVHTPGHTPEHIALVLTDTAAADQAMGMLTGDFVFAGDVGRPDLLERAAQEAGTMERSARDLFRSLRRLRGYPEFLQLWPGHGAGSACGKSLGAVPSTALGYERLFNWAFQIADEDAFVRAVLAGQPEAPMYFAQMKRINREGPPRESTPPKLRALDVPMLEAELARGREACWVLDTRPPSVFGAGFVPGTINVPAGRAFTTWAGSLVPPQREVALILPDDDESLAHALAQQLAKIGIDRVRAWGGAALLSAWQRSGRLLDRVPIIDSATLAIRPDLYVIDVRGDAEWAAGHIPGAKHLFLGELETRAAGLPRDLSLVVHCHGGTRSAIAASLLRAAGFSNVTDLAGGFAGWVAAGLPVEAGAATPAAR
ncbi:MAG TPA: MBL fold metallo-hydrolase [Gemmatimonadaceae bacterium]|nr:MBL fold metallo-hydrolase [Gemmatimonadaceae bacterium]